MKKGKLIVLDGTDGSGKATQVALLKKRLQKNGVKVKTIDFPQYKNNFFGKLIGECLAGKRGDFIKVDSRIASTLYAADRWETSRKIYSWLEQGYVVIADRYVSSNQIHQGGKIRNNKERREFLKWLDDLEFKVFKIPRPDLLLYLHLPVKLSFELLQKKSLTKKKHYLEGKKDLAESDVKHLEDSRKSALKLVKESNQWAQIECSEKGHILSREEINDRIFDVLHKKLGLKK
ncbi:MAG: dTMP kinase [Candidatus Zambryskibacteria bacterium CG10_big_fil_rev_8_21_14_0_10_42_12]|uniref:Thymidylate kinase n=1 Tax=Candidatus Zambryskibacteria bacterium CG10_big_fil_rev_8_21_14_0_10_42_12 TaxID=1975115 RepID=A0A2H0QY98_9BACT|nr:MAG: dTMP kinase [Candidatus Zambryskibacteria bacterium CG10_big_fil_rev_8_21_14_0_10_42_12]